MHKKPVDHWLVQAGISKNWFGYGNTSLYGEYGVTNDWGADFTNAGGAAIGRDYAAAAGFTAVAGVSSTEVGVWGFGIAQKFDAAATDIFVGYRHMDADIICTDNIGAATCTGGVTLANHAAGLFVNNKLSTEGIDVIVMGARVSF